MGDSFSIDKPHTVQDMVTGSFFDVGCPSVCCEYVLLPLVNKEADLAYGRTEYSKAEKLN